MDAMEHISKPSEDVGEVVFGQPEERAGATGPDGSVLDRRNEDGWLDDAEPYHGARPRTTEFDRPVDDVLGATIGGTEQDFNFRDTSVRSYLRNSEFDKKRRYRRHHEGSHAGDKWNGVGPWGPCRPTDRNCWSEPANRRVVTCGGIGEYSVTYAARSGGPADREPVSEDAEGTGARAPRTTCGTHDDKCLMR